MDNSVRIQFKSTLPLRCENILYERFGFKVKARRPGSFVVYGKDVTPVAKKNKNLPVVVVAGTLTEAQETDLIKQCNRIFDWFDDPVHHAQSIRIRLKNLAMTKPALERMFIEGWMDKYAPFGSSQASG